MSEYEWCFKEQSLGKAEREGRKRRVERGNTRKDRQKKKETQQHSIASVAHKSQSSSALMSSLLRSPLGSLTSN